jgi:hypothetical protein
MNFIKRHRRVAMAASGVALLVGVGLNTGMAGATPPSQAKAPLTNTNRNCDGTPATGGTGATLGSVVMNQTKATSNGKFTANLAAGVTLQGATPNATYNIRIIQDGAAGLVGSCTNIVGTVTTDAFGNGSADVATRALDGATQWWVDLNNRSDPNNDYLISPLVPIV